MIYFVTSVAAIAGLLFGYDEGVIAIALPLLTKEYPMTPVVSGFMTAAVPLGAVIGASVAGRITDRFGRRRVLMAAAAVFAVAALLAATITSISALVVARLFLGLAIGTAAVAPPLYIAEAAPLETRGALVSTYQLAITFGILASYVAGYTLASGNAWRLMFGLGAVPAIVLIVGLFFMPETPRWLALKGRLVEAKASILRLRGAGATVDRELEEIDRSVREDAGRRGGYAVMFEPAIRPALVVGMGLFLLQQLSGINAVIYYAPEIFIQAGFNQGETEKLATVGVGMVNFLTTIVAMYLIDQVGRRRLLVVGFLGTGVAMLAIALAVVYPTLIPSWVVIAALLLYIAAFAISLGPLPFVLMSEIFPLRARAAGMSMASLSNWGFNFMVVFTFPVMLAGPGLAFTFTLFAIICLSGVVFTLRRVPETTGHSLEEIEVHLASGKPLVTL
jgi:SP family galactose:H+ symporter-like MFS transporter